MSAIWLFIKAIVVIAMALIGAMFALENSQQLSVNFILFSSPELSVGLWLVLFFCIGTLFGVLASSMIIANYRRKLARAVKKD